MIWTRDFKPGTRGRVFGTLYRLIGKPMFGRYARQTLANLLELQHHGDSIG
jgi:hypothetical protein